ncbi:hypothetical protein [Sandaracinus amylolyticus]|uniref:DUF2141 domain-containing protein n=1 Tax=Sandaracinus amylolyticus TaxID=927083 RepID=A0A0F6YIS2_9BACT|nr:hypothetical protein [Sandaracinus amylolyticus]AKF05426.1 hypothetical protein DB32_002575 [Sandaracinus amylolyticus]
MTTRTMLALVFVLSACDERATTTADAGDDARASSTRGTIAGTITYDGSGAGRLTVGVWPQTPPAGPPSEIFVRDDPTFPIDYELRGLAAGTYYLGVVLDIGANHPTIPGAEDPRSFPTDGIVVEGDTHDVDVELVDPE